MLLRVFGDVLRNKSILQISSNTSLIKSIFNPPYSSLWAWKKNDRIIKWVHAYRRAYLDAGMDTYTCLWIKFKTQHKFLTSSRFLDFLAYLYPQTGIEIPNLQMFQVVIFIVDCTTEVAACFAANTQLFSERRVVHVARVCLKIVHNSIFVQVVVISCYVICHSCCRTMSIVYHRGRCWRGWIW